MKNIIGYIIAYFLGTATMAWYLTTKKGEESLAEVLQVAGYEYLAEEITGGQPLARKLASYEQKDREAQYLQHGGSDLDDTPEVMLRDACPLLEELLPWEWVEASYDLFYNDSNTPSMLGRLIVLTDGSVGSVVDYNTETGYVQILVEVGLGSEHLVDTTIDEVYAPYLLEEGYTS